MAVAVLAIFHWMMLGRIPILAAFATLDQMQASLVRDSISQTGIPLANYIPTVIVRSVVPFLGVYFISRHRYGLAWIALAIGLIYGISLMQKSYPLLTLVPPVLYCLLTRRPGRMFTIMALATSGVLLSFFASAPSFRPINTALLFSAKPAQQQAPQKSGSALPQRQPQQAKSLGQKTEVIAASFFDRIFMLPGKVVADWFSVFPSKMAYKEGCGYRFVSPFLGCKFEDTPSRLYPIFYPRIAAAGVHGSYNAAHFAEEYVNFGPKGLFLSGVLIAIVLAIAAVATARAGLAAAAVLNFAPIMSLTSGALHTTLLTGGWLFVMVLTYTLYRPENMNAKHPEM